MSDTATGSATRGRTESRDLMPVVVAVGLLAFAALAWYSSALDPLPFVGDLRRIDLLFVPALFLLCAYGVAPLVAEPKRAKPMVNHARERPLVAFSLLWVGLFVVVGLVAPAFIDLSYDLDATNQPPVYATVASTFTDDCLGTLAAGRCSGTWAHPLGTTGIGRDVLTLVLFGMREALTFATIVAALIVPVATTVGVVAGYRGGLTDSLLMRVVDVQQTLPAFVIYVIASFLAGESQFLLVAVFGLTSWGSVARIVRNETVHLKASDSVTAATVVGAGTLHVLRRHILPKLSGPIATAVTRQIPTLLLVEAALSYMELTVVTSGSWGRTIKTGMAEFPRAWWISAAPVVALCVTVVAFSVLGDSLRTVVDPRLDD
ncbi:ABC transporter permease [Haloferax volcanii]|uniref:ABC transporter permease n=3 Tax=Haloferax volcanii TaxID=2246 RepID=A0A8T5CJM5_HALVO|nr:ABC transporter permease [Haloferax volcanii]ADE03655.1 ABC-type transport system permease protein (probable substrate dipeptide/oligopeptide) [Haloferax volcanii DS2]ELY32357.1 putative dipeptides/oligopeptides ABC transporter permease [Haloferax volcanii DS2]MBS8118522.1 ABC transporter permease [Haloferax volcanii]MBS8123535.1 ABC transporter permease [Haloferax volcanii]MBS8127403.1 ABC transporter permease [Haloferax volcanii]